MLVASVHFPHEPITGRSPECGIFENALPVKADKGGIVVITVFIQTLGTNTIVDNFLIQQKGEQEVTLGFLMAYQ